MNVASAVIVVLHVAIVSVWIREYMLAEDDGEKSDDDKKSSGVKKGSGKAKKLAKAMC